MMNSDPLPQEEQATALNRMPGWLRITLAMLMPIVLIFLIGVMVGILKAHADHGGGLTPTLLLIIGIWIALFFGALWATAKLFRNIRQLGDGMSRRERISNRSFAYSAGAGAVIGSLLIIAEYGSEGVSLSTGAFSSTKISPIWAVTVGMLYLATLAPISWHWLKTIDEHELEANKLGALAAASAYGLGLPLWWILWKGELVPPVDSALTYILFMLIYCAVWGWKKFR